ncbi:hypothetical protein ACVI1K_007721 [Bradyrhizobium sp. USDA 4508]|nr:hypothetical protein [Bradyrhizobium sp. USDA 4541]
MATTITINVQNDSPSLQNFFFFQQPAVYTGGLKSIPTAYTRRRCCPTRRPERS